MEEWMDGLEGWMEEWMDGLEGWMEEWMDGLEGWMEEWMDELEGWMEEWMDGRTGRMDGGRSRNEGKSYILYTNFKHVDLPVLLPHESLWLGAYSVSP